MSKTLLVWPNPFHAIDHDGRPAGVLPYEPVGDGVRTFDDRRFVGAQLRAEITQRFPVGDARTNVQRTWFEYVEEAIRVPATDYYKLAIMRGEIFAADEESAKFCGIGKTFLEAGVLLERAREEALGAWKVQRHESAPEEPELLKKFAFGPMPEAVEARKKQAAEAKAKAEADAKADEAKKKAEAEATAKAETDAKNQAQQGRGGK